MSALPLLKPPAVPLDAAVSAIAPASFAYPDRVERGMKALGARGFSLRPGEHTHMRGPLFFAGTHAQRLSDFHAAFADPVTNMVMSLRGGYGSNYLLEGVDVEAIRQRPKPFFAYSDLTGMQLHLLDKLGLPAFHGPMMAADFASEDGVHAASFDAALAGAPYSVGKDEGMRALRPGTARGTLYGGCLSILVSLLQTRWEPETEGKLLFLEDTGTRAYQVDRMLWQLRQAGKLRDVRGVIFGEMLDCATPGAAPDLMEQTILSAFANTGIPIAMGLRSGHVSKSNVTLTFGVEAELRVERDAELRMLEPAVTR